MTRYQGRDAVIVGAVRTPIGKGKPGAMLAGQHIGTLQKSFNTLAIDELHGPTGPGRETDAENGADVGVCHRAQHTLLEAARGLVGLYEHQAPISEVARRLGCEILHRHGVCSFDEKLANGA